MPNTLLSHRAKDRAPEIQLFGQAPFLLGRVHEICGPARNFMAAQLAAKTQGAVLWIKPGWATESLLPAGLIEIIAPERILYVNAPKTEDLLWCMEEALRSGAAMTVISDLPTPPALTPIRRLHLAAEAGTRRGQKPPLSIILTPGAGGAQGVESRWHIRSILASNGKKWHLSRTRSRLSPVTDWQLSETDFGQEQ